MQYISPLAGEEKVMLFLAFMTAWEPTRTGLPILRVGQWKQVNRQVGDWRVPLFLFISKHGGWVNQFGGPDM